MKDKYSAIWVSHSSIGDFLKCPRAYYLNNVYKDKKTGHKMTIMQPALALGQAVHAVIEALSVLPAEERFKVSLLEKYDLTWNKVSGKLGGFTSADQEERYKERGAQMIRRVINNPGILKNKAVKINMELPHYWLSEEDNIILCGKIDWLEYLPQTDSVRIIDFKTGRYDENSDSLQLSIYALLVQNCQKRPLHEACYWYLERSDEPVSVILPDLEKAREQVLQIAKKIKVVRQLDHYVCAKKDGCAACLPFEKVLQGKAELVGVNDFGQDMYILADTHSGEADSVIL